MPYTVRFSALLRSHLIDCVSNAHKHRDQTKSSGSSNSTRYVDDSLSDDEDMGPMSMPEGNLNSRHHSKVGLLGIFHVRVHYFQPGRYAPKIQHIPSIYVHWFGRDTSFPLGFRHKQYTRIGFNDPEHAFMFLNLDQSFEAYN